MLGLDYRSDSEDESPSQPSSPIEPSVTIPAPNKSVNNGSVSGLSGKLNLPPPSKPTLSSSSSKGPSLPPPKGKKTGRPKKILVELPKLDKHASDDELSDEKPATKKRRLGGGKGGASSLLSMLPAPKKAAPELPVPERVLGGGRPGIVYSAASQKPKAPPESEPEADTSNNAEDDVAGYAADEETTTSMLPPSMLLKGKLKTQTYSSSKPSSSVSSSSSPAIDFFSLGSTSSSRVSAAPSISEPSSSSEPSIPSGISAAPKIEEFRPPSPKIDDPYPGYYQLPSGAWAMHDPEYYKTYAARWQREYEAQIRALEKNQKGFEGAGANGEDAKEVKASELSDAARAAREEKKLITERAGREIDRPTPKVAMNPTKMTGVARSRHQLHSLLADAFMNREAIEEKIAMGKRNRKEAGNKYGSSFPCDLDSYFMKLNLRITGF
ncbi:hypothetical protein ACEPAH_4471 [Sanghuangporus vaninii]